MKCYWCKGNFDETFTCDGDPRERQFCYGCLDSICNDPIDVAQQRRNAEECHLEESRERECEART